MGVLGCCMINADIENRFLKGNSRGLKEIPTDENIKALIWGFIGFYGELFWCVAELRLFNLLTGSLLRV